MTTYEYRCPRCSKIAATRETIERHQSRVGHDPATEPLAVTRLSDAFKAWRRDMWRSDAVRAARARYQRTKRRYGEYHDITRLEIERLNDAMRQYADAHPMPD